jgi:hypothetical protein
VQPIHLQLVALLTAAALLSQQLFLRLLGEIPDRLRRALLGAYLIAAAAWLVREVALR